MEQQPANACEVGMLAAAMPWQIPSDDWQNLEFGDFGQVSSLLEAAIPSDDWQDLEFGDF